MTRSSPILQTVTRSHSVQKTSDLFFIKNDDGRRTEETESQNESNGAVFVWQPQDFQSIPRRNGIFFLVSYFYFFVIIECLPFLRGTQPFLAGVFFFRAFSLLPRKHPQRNGCKSIKWHEIPATTRSAIKDCRPRLSVIINSNVIVIILCSIGIGRAEQPSWKLSSVMSRRFAMPSIVTNVGMFRGEIICVNTLHSWTDDVSGICTQREGDTYSHWSWNNIGLF